MNEKDVAALAARTFNRVVSQITDEQWDQRLPEWFPTFGDPATKTLRDIINGHAYDDAWVPEMLAGKTMQEAGEDAYKGDLLGNDPLANFASYADRALDAIEGVRDFDRTVHCSFGDYATRDYLNQVANYRGMGAYDVAKLIGVSADLPSDLVQGLYEMILPFAEEWRSYGVYGPKVEVPADAPLQDKLLGLTGRQPEHRS
jgi:uncharacterized protein (TIGR03086 family)